MMRTSVRLLAPALLFLLAGWVAAAPQLPGVFLLARVAPLEIPHPLGGLRGSADGKATAERWGTEPLGRLLPAISS
jgi:hypothetical protein